eukprot:scaffold41013_cov60-Phaeocystis_antarctica.AAC.3
MADILTERLSAWRARLVRLAPGWHGWHGTAGTPQLVGLAAKGRGDRSTKRPHPEGRAAEVQALRSIACWHRWRVWHERPRCADRGPERGGTAAGGSGGAGCSGGAADGHGGATAGAGGGSDAARGRGKVGLLWRAPHQARPDQALPGAGDARWEVSGPGHVCHRRGGGAVRHAIAGGTGGGSKACSGAEGCSLPDSFVLRAIARGAGSSGGAVCSGGGKGGGGATVERGGAAAGAGGGSDTARGQDRLLRGEPRQSRQAQALPGARVSRWQVSLPGHLRHRRGGRSVRRAYPGGTDRGGAAAGAAAGAGGGTGTARGTARQGGGGGGFRRGFWL